MLINNIVNLFGGKKNINKKKVEEEKKIAEEEEIIKEKILRNKEKERSFMKSKQEKWVIGYKNFYKSLSLKEKKEIQGEMQTDNTKKLITILIILFIGILVSFFASTIINKYNESSTELTKNFY